MHVDVGHFRHHGGEHPPEGTLSEMLGIQVVDDDDSTILHIIVDPQANGYVVQIDRYESGRFDAYEASRERVMLRVPRHGHHSDAPLPDNVRPIRPTQPDA